MNQLRRVVLGWLAFVAAAPVAHASGVTFTFQSTAPGRCDDPALRRAWTDATLLELGTEGVDHLVRPSGAAPADLVATYAKAGEAAPASITLAWPDCADPLLVELVIHDPTRRLRLVHTIDLGDVTPDAQARTVGLVAAELFHALVVDASPVARRVARLRDRAGLALEFEATMVPAGGLGMLGGGLVLTAPRLGGLPLAFNARLGASAGSVHADAGRVDLWGLQARLGLGLAGGNDDVAWSLGPAVDAAVVHVSGTPSDPATAQSAHGFGPRIAVGGYAQFQLRAVGPLFASLSAFGGGTVASTRATAGSAIVVDGGGLVLDVALGLGLTL